MASPGGFTPLDLRNRKREAQRAVRLAVNAVHSALDAWKAAVSDGKVHATALTNAALSQLHLPAVPLGLVEGVPGLRPAALAKLRQQQETALEELEACLARLQEAVGALAAAVGTLQQLLEAEAAAPLMGEGAVFATLPLRLLGGMLGEVHSMHSAELAVKAGVVQGMRQVVGDLREADEPGGGGGGGAAAGEGTGRAAAEREEALRKTLQVYVTAWLLSPEVDERRVEAHVAEIEGEMRGF